MINRASKARPQAARTIYAFVALLSGAACCGAGGTLSGDWQSTEIRKPASSGTEEFAEGTLSLSGSGGGVATGGGATANGGDAAQDEAHFVFEKRRGDVEIIARVATLGGDAGSQVGIMLRTDNGATSPMAAIWHSAAAANAKPTDQWFKNDRQPDGALSPAAFGSNVSAPFWLRLVRVGGNYACSWGLNGKDWVSAYGGILAPGALNAGLFVASGTGTDGKINTALAKATFDHISIGPPHLQYRTSWVGNSFSTYNNTSFVSGDAMALHVAPDGSSATNCAYDEAGQAAKIYKDGKVVLPGIGSNGVFGNNRAYEGSVAGDLTHFYFWSGYGGIYQTDLQGTRASTKKLAFSTKLVDEKSSTFISGLAAGGGLLYASLATTDKILVADLQTLKEIPERAFTFSQQRPGPLAVDRRGDIWIIQESTDFPMVHKLQPKYPTGVYCYSKDGRYTGRSISDLANPSALCIDPTQDRLLVCENGPAQNVRIYGELATAPRHSDEFGVSGGLNAGKTPGAIFDAAAGGYARFYSLAGVGVDAAGNVYVASGGNGTDLREFGGKTQHLLHSLYGLEAFESGDFDPGSDGRDAFTRLGHYRLDFTKTAPGSEWSYVGFTLNPFTKTGDERAANAGIPRVRRLGPQHRRVLFGVFGNNTLGFFRWQGEQWIPAGKINLQNRPDGLEFWTDKNGDGRATPEEVIRIKTPEPSSDTYSNYDVDEHGDLWLPLYHYLCHLTCTGVNSLGAPIYDIAPQSIEFIPLPGAFASGGIRRIKYDRSHDAMYMSGDTTEHTSWVESIGGLVCRYDNWSKGNRNARYQLVVPTPATNNDFMYVPPYPYGAAPLFKSLDVAGDKIFLWEEYGSIRVFDAALANPVTLISPGPEVSGFSAWEDPQEAHAFLRANGEYVTMQEDSAFYSRNLMYRWTPQPDAATPEAPDSVAVVPASAEMLVTWRGPRGLLSHYRIFRGDASGHETLLSDKLAAPLFHDKRIVRGQKYFYRVSAVNPKGESPPSEEAAATSLSSSAVLVKVDARTKGNWKGTYGDDGYSIPSDADRLPAYLQMTMTGAAISTFEPPGNDARALQYAAKDGRHTDIWRSDASVTFDLNLTDNKFHQVAIYGLDWVPWHSGNDVRIFDAATNAVLDVQRDQDMQAGRWYVWNVFGHVRITVRPTYANCVIGGLFFDPPTKVASGSPPASREKLP